MTSVGRCTLLAFAVLDSAIAISEITLNLSIDKNRERKFTFLLKLNLDKISIRPLNIESVQFSLLNIDVLSLISTELYLLLVSILLVTVFH